MTTLAFNCFRVARRLLATCSGVAKRAEITDVSAPGLYRPARRDSP